MVGQNPVHLFPEGFIGLVRLFLDGSIGWGCTCPITWKIMHVMACAFDVSTRSHRSRSNVHMQFLSVYKLLNDY